MSKRSGLSSGVVRGAGGALAVLAIAAGTGLVPMAGLQPARAVTLEPGVTPVTPPLTPVVPPVQPVLSSSPRDSQTVSGVTLASALGQGQLVRGSDGTTYLRCDVQVSDEDRGVRQAVDLALVLDTSGSMASAMNLLKRATLGIVERMNPEDRLTVVTYSNGANVIYQGPVSGPGMAKLESAVAGLVAAGGTNISSGLEAAANAIRPQVFKCGVGETKSLRRAEAPAERLRQAPSERGIAAGGRGCVVEPSECLPAKRAPVQRAKRILLLTDGLANQGIVDPVGLSRVVRGVRGRGIALSAMGLGASYNEQLLGALADTGGGRYHYVDRPEGLSAVYAAEVDALRKLVARNATLTIRPKAGRVEQVFSWSTSRSGEATQVRLGDLEQGRSLKVMVRLNVATGSTTPRLQDVVDVSLAFEDVQRQTPVQIAGATLSVGLTDDATLAASSVDAGVQGAVKEVEVARILEQARQEAQAGRVEEARRTVMTLKTVTGKEKLEYDAPSGATYEMELDDLAEDMADGASSERGRRAMKASNAAARSTAR